LGQKRIAVTTLTFQGHVTSSITSPLDTRTPFSICFFRQFLADRTNGRAIATLLRLSSSVVCDVMYCG